MLVGLAVGTRLRRPLASYSAFTFSNTTPVRRPFSWAKLLRHHEIQDRDILVHASSFSQGGRLHLLEAGADDNLHFVAAKATRRAAAVHGSVAAAEHDDTLADLADVAEGDGESQSMRYGYWPPLPCGRDLEIAAARAPEPTKIASQPSASSALRLSIALAADELDAEIEDVAALLVDDRFRQTEARDLRADHAPALGSWSNTTQ